MVKNNAWNFDTTYSTGDLLYASTTSDLAKRNIGSANQFLQVSGGLPTWDSVSGGSQSSQTFSLFSEFDGGFYGDQNGLDFAATVSGTWSQAGDATHPGVFELTTGTDSSSTIYINRFYSIVLNNGSYNLDVVAKIPTLSTSAQRFNAYIGFMDTFPVVNGCYFYYRDNVNTGRWQIKNTAASVTTTGSTTKTVDTNWHKYSIRVNSTATSIGYYVDDVQVSSSPLTANIPTAIIACGVAIDKDVGTTARTLLCDYMQLDVSLTSARS